MRINLINSYRPVVKYRATTIGGEVFTRAFTISRHYEPGSPNDLAGEMARAQRTFGADPYIASLMGGGPPLGRALHPLCKEEPESVLANPRGGT